MQSTLLIINCFNLESKSTYEILQVLISFQSKIKTVIRFVFGPFKRLNLVNWHISIQYRVFKLDWLHGRVEFLTTHWQEIVI